VYDRLYGQYPSTGRNKATEEKRRKREDAGFGVKGRWVEGAIRVMRDACRRARAVIPGRVQSARVAGPLLRRAYRRHPDSEKSNEEMQHQIVGLYHRPQIEITRAKKLQLNYFPLHCAKPPGRSTSKHQDKNGTKQQLDTLRLHLRPTNPTHLLGSNLVALSDMRSLAASRRGCVPGA
jgi:hypothetical protein